MHHTLLHRPWAVPWVTRGQYAMIGDLRPHYAAVLFLAGLVGTALGQQV